MKAKRLRPFIIGNWKMHGTQTALRQLDALAAGLAKQNKQAKPKTADIMICPPATLLLPMARQIKTRQIKGGSKAGQQIMLGGQDCHAAPSGAHTGDISAPQLRDAGAKASIVGHSERRTDYGETNKQVQAKATAAHETGLMAIICIGETLKERRAKATLPVVGKQLRESLPQDKPKENKLITAQNTVIAYEPVWAIGTGLTPTQAQIAAVHAHIRKALIRRFGAEGERIRLLYGGSVKPSNAAQLLAIPHVNGALVGGASLRAADFLKIIAAARQIG